MFAGSAFPVAADACGVILHRVPILVRDEPNMFHKRTLLYVGGIVAAVYFGWWFILAAGAFRVIAYASYLASGDNYINVDQCVLDAWARLVPEAKSDLMWALAFGVIPFFTLSALIGGPILFRRMKRRSWIEDAPDT